MPDEVTTRLIINICSDNLLVSTPFSLMIIRLSLVNNDSSALAPINFS